MSQTGTDHLHLLAAGEPGYGPPERPVPFDVPAEEAALGALLLDRDAIIKVADWLAAGMFYREAHGALYQAILELYDRREPPDLVTLASELDRRGILDQVGGPAYLGALMHKVPTAVHVEHYSTIVRDRFVRRSLITAGGQIAGLGYETGLDLPEVLDRAETILTAVRMHATRRQQRTSHEVMTDVYQMIGEGKGAPNGVIGLPTGLHELDAFTGGLMNEDLITVAARPGVGKSSLGNTIVYNLAVRPLLLNQAPTPVGVVTFEMSRKQYLFRLVAMHCGVSTQNLRLGRFTEEQWRKAEEGLQLIYDAPIFFDGDETADMSADDDVSIYSVRRRARKMRAEHDVRLLIVDYLQQMTGQNKNNRTVEVGEITRGLKKTARELQIPVVAMSQLSRALEARRVHVPMLSDLRESGSIEQDSDMVAFLHRPKLYDPDADDTLTEVHVAKYRNGPTGVVPLKWNGDTTSFSDWEDGYDPYSSEFAA